MDQSTDKFANLLTEAIYQIRLLEHKNISIVQDEVGYAIGREGGSPIEYWRKGHIPKDREEIEKLVKVLVDRGRMDEHWLADFLEAAGYIAPQPLINLHFPTLEQTMVMDSATPPSLEKIPSTLPLAPTPFVGRSAEISEIYELITGDDCRLVTLLGPGGIGKTRLAVEVGRRLLENKDLIDGVVYVPLGSVARAADIASALANGLEFQLSGSQNALDQLIGYLQTLNLLLILDNFENLVEKGSEIVADLLSQTPNLKILVTSRERLNLQWEQLYPLDGLLNTHQGSVGSEAADLFVGCLERANPSYRLTGPDRKAINEVCEMVAGFPLAIELAASWGTMLSVPEIAAEISSGLDLLETDRADVPERHRSLRAVCEYSVGALDEADRNIFQRLAIFRGGFSRQAASEIAGADLMVLGRLLDKSLVRLIGRNRYDLHLILRQYGYEMLTHNHDEFGRISLAHAEYYNRRLVEIAPDLVDFQHMALLEDVGEDLDNVRQMWRYGIKFNRLDLLEKAADGMMLYFHMSGRFQMGVTEFEAALSSKSIEAESFLRVRLLNRLALMQMRLNLGIEAVANFNEAVTVSRKIKNDLEIPMSNNFLSNIYSTMGQHEQALTFLRENLELDSNHQNPVLKASTLNNMGTIYGRIGRYDEALDLLAESETILRNLEQAWGLALFYQIHGEVAYHAGDFAGAERYFSVAIETYTDIGYPLGACLSIVQLGESLMRGKRSVEAASEFYTALELADQLHAIHLMLRSLAGLAQVPPLRHNHELVYEIASLVSTHPSAEDEVHQIGLMLLADRPKFPYSRSNGEWLVDIVNRIN